MNLLYYGQSTPPIVPLENISVPIGLYVGTHDQIADVKDNNDLAQILKTVVEHKEFDEDHLSLSFSKNMTYFKEVMATMEEYRRRTA